jgi:hypothetical protein
MDKGHSVKALIIYPEFPGCRFNCEFYDLTLLYGEGKVLLFLQLRRTKGDILCR